LYFWPMSSGYLVGLAIRTHEKTSCHDLDLVCDLHLGRPRLRATET